MESKYHDKKSNHKNQLLSPGEKLASHEASLGSVFTSAFTVMMRKDTYPLSTVSRCSGCAGAQRWEGKARLGPRNKCLLVGVGSLGEGHPSVGGLYLCERNPSGIGLEKPGPHSSCGDNPSP